MVRVFGVSVRSRSVNSGSRIGIIMRRGVGWLVGEREGIGHLFADCSGCLRGRCRCVTIGFGKMRDSLEGLSLPRLGLGD